MGRWAPGAQDRLQQAALELYGERGYDGTTVAGIAARAGLTERTFFRYFADKREVLFAGQERLSELVVTSLPADLAPLDAVAAGFEAADVMFDGRRPYSAVRQDIIDAHPELQERELIKLARLAETIADALRRRGVADAAAALAADSGVAIFRLAFARWVRDGDGRGLGEHVRDALAELRAVTA